MIPRKANDDSQAVALPMDLEVSHTLWNRKSSHALAYGFFCLGAVYSWCVTGKAFVLTDAVGLLAIAWFPALIVEVFRRVPLANPAVAAAMLSGIAGYDGVLRLLRPWTNGC